MTRARNALLTVMTLIFLLPGLAAAHCEIPCGIYDDAMRIQMILENATTIEKAMQQIKTLEEADATAANSNQLTRWIVNKEDHANQLQEIVSQYFMTQRIAPGTKHYQQKLALLHEMLIAAMKSKQTVDPAHVKKLRDLVAEFEKLYFEGHEH